MNEPTPPAPRVLILAGTPHPKALVQSVDAATGLCAFAWLNADGERVDSGGSVARFIVSWEPGELPDERVYIEPTDAELADAIANPPAEVAPVPASVTRRQLLVALFTATGVKDTDILASLGAIPDAATRYVATVEFTQASEFQRSHPLVTQLAAQLGLSSEEVDDIFRAASLL